MKTIKDKAWLYASGYFLTESFPEKWQRYSPKRLLEFIEEHKTECYEDWDESKVLIAIGELADLLTTFSISIMPDHKKFNDFLNDNPQLRRKNHD